MSNGCQIFYHNSNGKLLKRPLATLREANYDSAQPAEDCSLRLRSGSNPLRKQSGSAQGAIRVGRFFYFLSIQLLDKSRRIICIDTSYPSLTLT